MSRSVKPFDDLSTCPLSRASPTSSPQGGESRQTKQKMQPSFDSDGQWTEKHHPSQGLTPRQTPGSISTHDRGTTLHVGRPRTGHTRRTPATSLDAARFSDDCSPRGSPPYALPPAAQLLTCRSIVISASLERGLGLAHSDAVRQSQPRATRCRV